jgi:hypothetical protein
VAARTPATHETGLDTAVRPVIAPETVATPAARWLLAPETVTAQHDQDHDDDTDGM